MCIIETILKNVQETYDSLKPLQEPYNNYFETILAPNLYSKDVPDLLSLVLTLQDLKK